MKTFYIIPAGLLLLPIVNSTVTLNHAGPHYPASRCLYISSGHQGDYWSDGIERALKEGLQGHCQVRQFDMDSGGDEFQLSSAATRATELIREWAPDVVITSADDSARDLIAPYFQDTATPFVFCGVNWNVGDYGLPFDNVTGIVEIAPASALFQNAIHLSDHDKNAAYVGADTLSERNNFQKLYDEAFVRGVRLTHMPVASFSGWREAYRDNAKYDFVILGNTAAIDDWNEAEAHRVVRRYTEVPTVTTDKSMMPFSVLGRVKIASEHGKWAAAAAAEILEGANPAAIPIAASKRTDFWINKKILDQLNLDIDQQMLRKAKKIDH